EQTAGVGKRFFGGYRRFFAPSKKWGYISNENGGFSGTIATGCGLSLLHHLRWSPSSSEEVF
ncbi:MAG: hypothetical protein IJA70_09310, partial [Oscillospiraceae bacterium]|nr:hypothetical protein [Oscillospiraceae bacterium]